ncbi:MAG: NADH dehydrogenase (quinone) subunit D [Planctomycetota bacterium]|jgi:NADH dehydrogenase I D subunit
MATRIISKKPDGLESRPMVMNLGPSHPAMHGTLRIIAEVDGETIVKASQEIGYLHCGFEKLAESRTYTQWLTVTDRMNYVSALSNNIGLVLAAEALLGIEVPERCRWIRTILSELGRLSDHVMNVGLMGMDLGAFTVMLWGFKDREKLYDIFEACCGGRMTMSYPRVGGLARDVPKDFKERVREGIRGFLPVCDEFETMLTKNRIWLDRTMGTGVISAEDAIRYGVTGPPLRASGVPYDLRRDDPYLCYDEVEFDVITSDQGDVNARYHVRLEEMREAVRIIEQCLEKMPDTGPVNVDDFGVILPPKDVVGSEMEGLIHHFKLIMEGMRTPVGEVYHATEAPCGELGFYIASAGEGKPYRMHVRAPSFYNYQPYGRMIEGQLISDAIATMASMNIVAGELDR